MLHINIVGVVTCSDNSTRRLVTCNLSLDLFSIHFIITLHSSIAATSASQYQKKNENWTKCYQFLSCLAISCPAISCPAISCPAISCLAILMVGHFHVCHFQRPRIYIGWLWRNSVYNVTAAMLKVKQWYSTVTSLTYAFSQTVRCGIIHQSQHTVC